MQMKKENKENPFKSITPTIHESNNGNWDCIDGNTTTNKLI